MTQLSETFENKKDWVELNAQKLETFLSEKSLDQKFITLAKQKIDVYISTINKESLLVRGRLMDGGAIEDQIWRAIYDAQNELTEKSKLPLPKKSISKIQEPVSKNAQNKPVEKIQVNIGSAVDAIRKRKEELAKVASL